MNTNLLNVDEKDDTTIKPSDAKFDVIIVDGSIILYVSSISEDKDDIRSIYHPVFDDIWYNVTENTFELAEDSNITTVKEAIDWCTSIGMTYIEGL